jgi:uncharacterized membrane protein
MTRALTAPSREDSVVRGLSQVIGGPIGRHANAFRRFWTPMRVALATTCGTLAVHWVQKSPCRDGVWEAGEQYSKACYTDVLALYYAERLNVGAVPYLDHPVEYPVLTGALMGLVGLPVHALSAALGGPDSGLNEGRLFYDLTTVVLALCALFTVWAVVKLRPHRQWDAMMVAVSPAILLTASVNWDLLAVALSTLALLAWARRYPTWAGILLGLAAAAKFYPLLVLGPLVLLCFRQRRLVEGGVTVGLAVAAWLAVNIPVMVSAPESWLRFYRFSSERGVDWGTFWYVGVHWPRGGDEQGFPPFTDLAANVPALNLVSAGLFAVCCVGIAALALRAPMPPRLAALVFLTVAAFLLTNKVWSQQFVLWLVPLAVLARPRWGAFLAWQGCEFVYFLAFYQRLLGAGTGKPTVPEGVFLLASMARMTGLAVLCALVVREVLRPDLDLVRRTEGGRGGDRPLLTL